MTTMLFNLLRRHQQLFVCSLLLYFIVPSTPISLKVEPKAEECFYEDMDRGVDVVFEWSVIDGGLLDIEIRVKKDDTIMWSKLYFEGRDPGEWIYSTTLPGTYAFCFSNHMARFTVKAVWFDLKLKKQAEQLASPDDISPMERLIKEVELDLTEIKREEHYFKIREMVARNTAESTNERVQWWSIGESVLILLMSFGQIYYLRRLFSDRARDSHRDNFKKY